jgi:hypothetical protein
MGDREQMNTSKGATKQKPQRDRRIEVGRDVPDESKERHTEVAVEAGRKGGEHHGEKH